MITSEIELDHFEVSDDHWRFSGRLLVIVVPFATQTFRFVPDFNELLVVLDDYCVLVEFALGVWFGTASVVDDGETEIVPSRFRLNVDTVVASILAFGEDKTCEWFVK